MKKVLEDHLVKGVTARFRVGAASTQSGHWLRLNGQTTQTSRSYIPLVEELSPQ